MNVTFKKLENTASLFGDSQVGVYVGPSLLFFITNASPGRIYCDDWRIFTVPSDQQITKDLGNLCGITHYKGINQFKELSQIKEMVETHITSLVEIRAKCRAYNVCALLKSGIICGIYDESYGYGNVVFDSHVSCGKIFRDDIGILIERLKKEKPCDVVEVYATDIYTAERQVIYVSE